MNCRSAQLVRSFVHSVCVLAVLLASPAPALDAQGIGGDVNSVAEYLDNTLPPDQVPALEKVCLENEMHLGEVASCHQILTLVLGEAADVSDQMRQRAYGIAPTLEGAPEETQAASATAVADPPQAPGKGPEIDDLYGVRATLSCNVTDLDGRGSNAAVVVTLVEG